MICKNQRKGKHRQQNKFSIQPFQGSIKGAPSLIFRAELNKKKWELGIRVLEVYPEFCFKGGWAWTIFCRGYENEPNCAHG